MEEEECLAVGPQGNTWAVKTGVPQERRRRRRFSSAALLTSLLAEAPVMFVMNSSAAGLFLLLRLDTC